MQSAHEIIEKHLDSKKEIVYEVDGYLYYYPSGCGNGGVYSANTLRIIADILDERNRAWDQYIDDYFANEFVMDDLGAFI